MTSHEGGGYATSRSRSSSFVSRHPQRARHRDPDPSAGTHWPARTGQSRGSAGRRDRCAAAADHPDPVRRDRRPPSRPRATRQAGPVVVWYHGGGFVTGDLETHRGFAAEVARLLDLPVVLVDYRLAPEAPYPAAVEDAEDAARWVASHLAELGRAADALVLGGDSAGGTLAIVTAMALRDAPAEAPIRAHIAIYPATDLSRPYPSQKEFASGRMLTEAGRRWYYGQSRADIHDWHGSPLLGDLTGLPPAVVLTAGEDPVRDEGRAYAAALIAAGVPTTFLEAAGHIHAFVLMRRVVPSTQDDLARAFAALSATVRAARTAAGAAA